MKEEEVEGQGGEEAAAAATTAAELPSSNGMSNEGHNLGGQGWGYNFSHHSCR